MVPLKHLVKKDAVRKPAETDAEQDSGAAGASDSLGRAGFALASVATVIGSRSRERRVPVGDARLNAHSGLQWGPWSYAFPHTRPERFLWRLAGQEPTNREGGVPMATSAKRVGAEVEEKLVKHIDEAYAMEQNVLRMLDGMISSTEDAEMRRELEQHKLVTEQQAERLQKRLEAHDAAPSVTKEAGGILGALMKGAVDMARADKAGRNARDGFATEHMEIASYELLERVAKRAGDSETAAVARQNRREEREMARKISANWDKVVELTLSDK